MRFFANGPSIPDELLWERDEGKVVFFCGAGVSRAYAGLPDFFGLANVVAKHLGIGKDSDAYRLIHSAHEIEKNAGISGLISADRIFGLLERDFRAGDIEEAVASALNPEKQDSPKKPNYLEAHQILLDLATGVDGKVRLVTTNFDRLFEQCRKRLKIWQPPKLPDPSRVDEMDGIVYLHGLATKDYQGAEGDGFILSTSQFGKAYLAEGWATQFIRQLLDNYTIVFVGYSADDPPVQYLLEALHKMKATHKKIYAFQSNDGDDVINRWKYKGVTPICFPRGRYKILWRTLGAWAKRARNPDKWYEQVIKKFASNPRVLKYSKHGQISYRKVKPFERGQIAHIVSSSEGAKKFAHTKPVPSAEWLFVFDKFCRYAPPDQLIPFFPEEHFVDPFSLYSLDSDVLLLAPKDENLEREPPSDAWDALNISKRDLTSVNAQNNIALCRKTSQLVNCLEQLALWITEVIDHPATICWAIKQKSLNSIIINNISKKLASNSSGINMSIQEKWKLLIEISKNTTNVKVSALLFKLRRKKWRWTATYLSQFAKITCPHLSVEFSNFLQLQLLKSQRNKEITNESAIFAIDYPKYQSWYTIIPDDCLASVIKVLRTNLEFTNSLRKAFNLQITIGFKRPNWHDTQISNLNAITGLADMIMYFSLLFNKLCNVDLEAAKSEFLTWPKNDDIIFANLRIMAAGKRELVPDDEFEHFIASLSDETFKNCEHEDDLLSMLATRWVNLNISTRSMIEKRLLENTPHFTEKDQLIRRKWRAWRSLNRLQRLIDEGCELSTATQKKAQKLRSVAPDWTEEQARNATRRITSGFVATNTDYTALLNIPLSELLPEADRIQQNWDDIHAIYRPFEGLVVDKPVRAFSALCLEAKKGIFPEREWRIFFNSVACKSNRNRFKWLIANRLLNYSDEQIAIIIKPVVYWLYNTVEILENTCIPVFFHLAKKIIKILQIQPDKGQSNIEQSIDKLSDAINTPAGMVTLALLEKPFKQNLSDEYFYKEWFDLIESLLKLPDISRQYVLVMLFREINWFFQTDKDWTQKHLLPVFHSSKSIDRDAAWAGFLRARVLPCSEIFSVIKDDLFKTVKNRSTFYLKNTDNFARLILESWGKADDTTGERYITDEEFHELLLKSNDKFRTEVLKLVEVWIRGPNTNNSSDEWKSRLPEFFSTWPKQIDAWSPKVSTGFFNLLIWSGEQFPILLKLVINHLNKIYDINQLDFGDMIMPDFGNTIIQDYPKELLELLYTVLPNDIRQRPYDMSDILKKIVEADSNLKKDERYIELKRRYAI
ncbi:SIR2 family protein [Bartonella sp. W8097]|uniref:SIR2 family protein n=1 Tax=Bartonella apihabitans TaxID=2750929 RepID=UPI0018DC952C|nr:SIR2 family protein [Bartonella apihabitans]MBI0021652.1 SIR2 family protein [Bartonella apihabitans]